MKFCPQVSLKILVYNATDFLKILRGNRQILKEIDPGRDLHNFHTTAWVNLEFGKWLSTVISKLPGWFWILTPPKERMLSEIYIKTNRLLRNLTHRTGILFHFSTYLSERFFQKFLPCGRNDPKSINYSEKIYKNKKNSQFFNSDG